MELLPAFKNRQEKALSENFCRNLQHRVKKSKTYYSERINLVPKETTVEDMVAFASQRQLSYIGIGVTSRHGIIGNTNSIADPYSIEPLLLSVAMVDHQNQDRGRIYRFVIDLRPKEKLLLAGLSKFFGLPVTFVCHQANNFLFCIWQLGLVCPDRIWDTRIFEKALTLGKYNKKYFIRPSLDENNQIQIIKDLEEQEAHRLRLSVVCGRYGLPYAMECSEERLRESFELHPCAVPFSCEQVEYAVEDAIAANRIYPLQTMEAVEKDILVHCISIEMPWVVTNARIQWNGVRIDREKIKYVAEEITSTERQCQKILMEKYGIKNIQRHDELYEFFNKAGILNSFNKHKTVSFEKDLLKQNDHLHPAIPTIIAAKQAEDFLSNKILSAEFIGRDGRVHALHIQLGADTGRQTCRSPNLLGLNKALRPLIIPGEGFGIGEADYCQMEIGVAAALFKDSKLIDMFNTGDVYSAMAQYFFKNELSENEFALSGDDFKEKFPEYRKK